MHPNRRSVVSPYAEIVRERRSEDLTASLIIGSLALALAILAVALSIGAIMK